jgi:predicted RNase H-like nuclease
VGAQAWALYRKIREVDELLGASPDARRRVREVHPEVSFWAWNGHEPIQEGKKSAEGRVKRLRLAEGWLGPGILGAARAGRAIKELGDDDILDALAALWTATRVAEGSAMTLPATPPLDAAGLRMEIVY